MLPFKQKPNGIFTKNTAVIFTLLILYLSDLSSGYITSRELTARINFRDIRDTTRDNIHFDNRRQPDRFVNTETRRDTVEINPYIRDVRADSRQSRIDARDIRTDFREIRTELRDMNNNNRRVAGNLRERQYSRAQSFRQDSRAQDQNPQQFRYNSRDAPSENRREVRLENSRLQDSRHNTRISQDSRMETRVVNPREDRQDSRIDSRILENTRKNINDRRITAERESASRLQDSTRDITRSQDTRREPRIQDSRRDSRFSPDFRQETLERQSGARLQEDSRRDARLTRNTRSEIRAINTRENREVKQEIISNSRLQDSVRESRLTRTDRQNERETAMDSRRQDSRRETSRDDRRDTRISDRNGRQENYLTSRIIRDVRGFAQGHRGSTREVRDPEFRQVRIINSRLQPSRVDESRLLKDARDSRENIRDMRVNGNNERQIRDRNIRENRNVQENSREQVREYPQERRELLQNRIRDLRERQVGDADVRENHSSLQKRRIVYTIRDRRVGTSEKRDRSTISSRNDLREKDNSRRMHYRENNLQERVKDLDDRRFGKINMKERENRNTAPNLDRTTDSVPKIQTNAIFLNAVQVIFATLLIGQMLAKTEKTKFGLPNFLRRFSAIKEKVQ